MLDVAEACDVPSGDRSGWNAQQVAHSSAGRHRDRRRGTRRLLLALPVVLVVGPVVGYVLTDRGTSPAPRSSANGPATSLGPPSPAPLTSSPTGSTPTTPPSPAAPSPATPGTATPGAPGAAGPQAPGAGTPVAAPAPVLGPGIALTRGSAGPDVLTWQTRMAARGWRITPDGVLGPRTEHCLREFQQEKGLAVDGVVGVRTWTAAWTAPVT